MYQFTFCSSTFGTDLEITQSVQSQNFVFRFPISFFIYDALFAYSTNVGISEFRTSLYVCGKASPRNQYNSCIYKKLLLPLLLNFRKGPNYDKTIYHFYFLNIWRNNRTEYSLTINEVIFTDWLSSTAQRVSFFRW